MRTVEVTQEVAEEVFRLHGRIETLKRALEEIREVWAGAEVGEPVYCQEAYAIRLCKQQYQIACDALSTHSPKSGE